MPSKEAKSGHASNPLKPVMCYSEDTGKQAGLASSFLQGMFLGGQGDWSVLSSLATNRHSAYQRDVF